MVKSFLQLNVSSTLKGNSNPWGFPLQKLLVDSQHCFYASDLRGGCDNFAEKMLMKATAAKKWCFLGAMTAGQPQPVHPVVLSGSATGLIPWIYIAAQLNSKINLYLKIELFQFGYGITQISKESPKSLRSCIRTTRLLNFISCHTTLLAVPRMYFYEQSWNLTKTCRKSQRKCPQIFKFTLSMSIWVLPKMW